MRTNRFRTPRSLPVAGLLAVATAVSSGCGDYDVPRRTALAEEQVPSDELVRFELSSELLPASKASWLDSLSVVEKRHWPDSVYADYLSHRRMIAAMGRRAPKWPPRQLDRVRFEPFRRNAQAHFVRAGDEALYFVSRLTRRRAASDDRSLPGGYHDVAMLWVAAGDAEAIGKERIILRNVDGGRPDTPLELQIEAYDEDIVIVYGTSDAIMQLVGRLTKGEWVFTEPRVVHRTDAAPCDIRLARSADRLHLIWTEDRRSGDPGAVQYSNTGSPNAGWRPPVAISSGALNGTADLLAEGEEVFVAWTDDRFRRAEARPDSPLGWIFVTASRDGGETFSRPALASEVTPESEQLAARVVLALADDDLVLYWSKEQGPGWPQHWEKALLDRDMDVLRAAGPVEGRDLRHAYAQRMAVVLGN